MSYTEIGTSAQLLAVDERERFRMQANREELVDLILRAVPEDGAKEPIEGLVLRRTSSPTEGGRGVSQPTLCVVAQGSKEFLLGQERYRYDPYHYLIVTAELPYASQVVEASPEHPFLCIVLYLEPNLVHSVIIDAERGASSPRSDIRAVHVSPLDAGLLDAMVRLVRLVESPEQASFLAPLIKREIVYRLLQGEQRGRLYQVAAQTGHTQHIIHAIRWLRENFDKPLRIEQLARDTGMSVSNFHYHFKAITGMTPLQYHKQLRLQEARRLMLNEGLDATSAGHLVGYQDISHFIRDYRRLFGSPPVRDIERLREDALEGVP